MKASFLRSIPLVLFSPLLLLAFQTTEKSVAISELKSSPFTAGPLKLTVTHFRGTEFFARYSHLQSGIQITVENTSDTFATFEPRRLSVVDKDNEQADVLGLDQDDEVYAAEIRRIAPEATINVHFILTARVDLPARIYYDDRLLGIIR